MTMSSSSITQGRKPESSLAERIALTIGVDSKLLAYGLREYVWIRPFNPPHLAILGNSGSGKTYLDTEILGRLCALKECEVVLADFKGVDFQWLQGCRNFYQYLDVGEGLNYIYSLMNRRMSSGKPTSCMQPVFFVCDEWAGYLSVLEKKEADTQKKKLSALLMLGRGVSICCVLSLQRADSEYFQKARDNIGHCVLLGSPSKESIEMVAAPYKGEINPQPRGRGYLISDGSPLRSIHVTAVQDMERLRGIIRKGLNRTFE